jgi:hypothetical protein
MFAPSVIRHAAERQFHNFTSLAVTLACFLASWLVFGGGTANVWIGLFFAGFVAYQILRPMASADGSRVGIGGLVLLLVIAIVGPVAIGLIQKWLPDLGDWSVNAPLLVSLVCALLATFCFGMALKAQLQGAPQAVGSARVIDTLNINVHPSKLMEELDRTMMAGWFQQIPNRRYAHAEPVVEGQNGSFNAELLEETQPRPRERSTAQGVADAFGTPEFRWLALLSALFVLLTALGTLAALRFVDNLLHARDLSTSVGYSISLLTVAFFCWRAAHVLWGRFDFVSEVTWVELQGSFESARLNMGNQISDRMQSSKSVINIEAMTLRVWASELDSVIFGKDAGRQVIGMRSLPEHAQSLAKALKKFGEERSMVVAPSSQEDMLRAARMGAVNRVVGVGEQAGGADKMQGRAPVVLTGDDAELDTAAALICRACKQPVLAQAAFCSGCGARLS